jgi:hypothetical protein
MRDTHKSRSSYRLFYSNKSGSSLIFLAAEVDVVFLARFCFFSTDILHFSNPSCKALTHWRGPGLKIKTCENLRWSLLDKREAKFMMYRPSLVCSNSSFLCVVLFCRSTVVKSVSVSLHSPRSQSCWTFKADWMFCKMKRVAFI